MVLDHSDGIAHKRNNHNW